MKNNEPARHLTFSQRNGYEALPKAMRLEELSDDLKREIWNIVRRLLVEKRGERDNTFGGPRYYFYSSSDQRFAERVIGGHSRVPEERIPTNYGDVESYFRDIILNSENFNKTLDFIEILVNDPEGAVLVEDIKSVFNLRGAAYRLDTSTPPYQFLPCASKEQGDAIQKSIEILHAHEMRGAEVHLRDASSHINAQQYRDAIVDSIHAVESVARLVDPKASTTLGPALNSLEKEGLLKSKVLKSALQKLYNYTNSAQGLRHALLDKKLSDIGQDEALFMFGACASFAAYLANKQHQMKPSNNGDS